MSYSFGFSWEGFIIVLLPMIPNIFYFMLPNVISSGKVEKKNFILDVIEHGSQIIYIGLLIFVINNRYASIQSGYVIGMAIFLLLYYVLWGLLFSGKKNIMILLGLVVFPVVYFILGEILIYNFIAIIPTIIFGIVHVIITYTDFSF